jgi:hypothetical protein
MLTGQMPLILFKIKRVLYWGDASSEYENCEESCTPEPCSFSITSDANSSGASPASDI